ncbi:hypothetical protein NK529_005029 [Citrobacter amalonaticus]
MADTYKITITTTSKETFTGLMKRSQPEIVNGFVALATDTGEWRYSIRRMWNHYTLSR